MTPIPKRLFLSSFSDYRNLKLNPFIKKIFFIFNFQMEFIFYPLLPSKTLIDF